MNTIALPNGITIGGHPMWTYVLETDTTGLSKGKSGAYDTLLGTWRGMGTVMENREGANYDYVKLLAFPDSIERIISTAGELSTHTGVSVNVSAYNHENEIVNSQTFHPTHD